MKSHFLYLPNFFSLPTLLITALLFANVGCPDRSRKDADPIISSVGASHANAPAPAAVPATPAPVPDPSAAVVTPTTPAPLNPDPFADISLGLDNTTRDTTAGLASLQTAMDKEIDAQIAAWKAGGATSTTMLEGKLSLARTDFSQKLSALSLAGEETWKNTKEMAQASLQNLRRVYREYLAGPPKE